ncbi:MAG: RnfABCDGE type electron transport complex subunit D [Oscillospiraceae bacterium]|nr:RnfABCDGE type electron transport complex subunit D [Oscillospiraceae bacterium]
MNEKNERMIFDVTYQPQVRTVRDTQRIMLDVIIATLPIVGFGVYRFGWHALLLVVSSMAAAVFFEWAYRRILKKSITIDDLSAAVTGLLLVMVLPPQTPVWMAVIGDFFAIVIVKQLYGGIGKNFLNPALAGRAFLTASYSGVLTIVVIDGVTAATPLGYLYGDKALPFTLAQSFFGAIPGSIGEVSSFAILAGAAYLIARKVIRWRIPLSVIGTVFVVSFLGGHAGYGRLEWALQNVCAGGVMFTGIFMATDYATSPVTISGQIIYGIGIGLLTMLIRYFGGYAEGCSYAILIMNLCTWAIDKACHRRQFGVSRAEFAAQKTAKKNAKKEAVS